MKRHANTQTQLLYEISTKMPEIKITQREKKIHQNFKQCLKSQGLKDGTQF